MNSGIGDWWRYLCSQCTYDPVPSTGPERWRRPPTRRLHRPQPAPVTAGRRWVSWASCSAEARLASGFPPPRQRCQLKWSRSNHPPPNRISSWFFIVLVSVVAGSPYKNTIVLEIDGPHDVSKHSYTTSRNILRKLSVHTVVCSYRMYTTWEVKEEDTDKTPRLGSMFSNQSAIRSGRTC